MRYGMAIDIRNCIGCHTCSMACKSANNIPNEIWWSRVQTVGGKSMDICEGIYPHNRLNYLPINCQHCGNPPCVKACPVDATYKRADGIVVQDYDKCIGCRACMVACPYGARSFNAKKPAYSTDFALGDADAAPHQYKTVEKCTFCAHRLAKGEKPACMVLCPGRARYYGDLDDPQSEVSKAIRGRSCIKLQEERGTEPSIFYLT